MDAQRLLNRLTLMNRLQAEAKAMQETDKLYTQEAIAAGYDPGRQQVYNNMLLKLFHDTESTDPAGAIELMLKYRGE